VPYRDQQKAREHCRERYLANKDRPEYKEKIKINSRRHYLLHKAEKLARSRECERAGLRKDDHKKWQLNNPDKVRAASERSNAKWRSSGKYRTWYLKRYYNLSTEEYEKLLEQQNNLCGICGKNLSEVSPCVDHEHETGRVRGLLCRRCNSGIGHFSDDPELIRKAIVYVRSVQQRGEQKVLPIEENLCSRIL